MNAQRFRPYPAYKDFAGEWLGEIPAHWEVLKLKRVCSFAYGDSLASEARVDGEFAVYGSNGPVGTHDCANTIAPCVVIGRKGSFGKVAFSPDPVFAIDTAFFVDRRGTQADIRWLYYVLTNVHLDSASKDSAIPGLDREDAYARELCLCSSVEQRAIAAFLDRETARIDALVTKKDRLIELLQEQRTALITRAVTKGLDPNVPMKDSGVEWLGEIPTHWEVKRLRHISPSLGVGVVVNPSQYVASEGLPFLYGSDISEGWIDTEGARRISLHDSRRLPKSQLQPGDLVMVRVGAPGVTAVVPPELDGANCASLLVIRRSDVVASSWLCYALNSRYVRSQVEGVQYGAAQEQFNVSHAVNFVLAVPPLREQEMIAACLERDTARVAVLVASVWDAIDRLKELRTALISAAVTGKIDVREEVA